MKNATRLAVVPLLLALAGCGGADSAEPAAEAAEPEQVETTIDLLTDSGEVAVNEDDASCYWGETQIIVRDGAGEVLATYGPHETTGQVRDTKPNYECWKRLLHFDVLPVADFYEFEVKTEREAIFSDETIETGTTETLARADVEDGTVELEPQPEDAGLS